MVEKFYSCPEILFLFWNSVYYRFLPLSFWESCVICMYIYFNLLSVISMIVYICLSTISCALYDKPGVQKRPEKETYTYIKRDLYIHQLARKVHGRRFPGNIYICTLVFLKILCNIWQARCASCRIFVER